MTKQEELESFLKLPIEEQRRICTQIFTESTRHKPPTIEDTIVEPDIPIDDFMMRNGVIRLSEFEDKIRP